MSYIAGYGVYIPESRLKLKDIAEVWQKDASEVVGGLKVKEKSVASADEDSVTMAVQASTDALQQFGTDLKQTIGAVYMGSESHPYAVNPSSSSVAEMLGVGNEYFSADLEFACKAGTAAIQIVDSFIDSGKIEAGLAIGSDAAQGKPHDILEYTACAAAASYILHKSKGIAEIKKTVSFTSNTPDFWRREGAKYPSHFGRFTGEPAYFNHVMSATKMILEKTDLKAEDFTHCVFHMPNGKFPRLVSKRLGFSPDQLAASLVVDEIGNSYSASSLVGLAAVLDIAKPFEKICLVSYGSGAGADAFVLETTNEIGKNKGAQVAEKIKNKSYISYGQYLKNTRAI